MQCIEAIRRQNNELNSYVAHRLNVIDDNLKRLYDTPGEDDEVFVDGKLCKVQEGFLVLPKPGRPAKIEPAIVQAIVALATGKRKISPGDQPAIDMALDQSSRLLATIDATQPDLLGKVAEFMARIYRERHSSGARSKGGAE